MASGPEGTTVARWRWNHGSETLNNTRVKTWSERNHFGRILVGAALMYVVLQGGLSLLIPRFDQTWSALIVTAAMFAVAFVIEGVAFKRTPMEALAALGLGRPRSGR